MAGVEDSTTFVQKTTGILGFVGSRAKHTPDDPPNEPGTHAVDGNALRGIHLHIPDGVPETENRRLAWPAHDDRTGVTIA